MTEEQGKKSGLMGWKMVALGLVLFILGMVVTFTLSAYVFRENDGSMKQETKNTADGPLVKVGDFTVNIANPEGRKFLKTEIHMEVKDVETQKIIEPKIPIVQDKVLTVLSSKTVADLEPYNRDNLKQELLNQINSVLGGSNPVQNVYFTVFIIN
ncbi:MAG: flagellar basal body-associated FliL family protein [Syntrophomonadaceae bacterium]|nr:flagellar basal body-associated FliL family protein [Syntrophomonadaceae bacterium]